MRDTMKEIDSVVVLLTPGFAKDYPNELRLNHWKEGVIIKEVEGSHLLKMIEHDIANDPG